MSCFKEVHEKLDSLDKRINIIEKKIWIIDNPPQYHNGFPFDWLKNKAIIRGKPNVQIDGHGYYFWEYFVECNGNIHVRDEDFIKEILESQE